MGGPGEGSLLMVMARYWLFPVFAHGGGSWMFALLFACDTGDAAFAWIEFHLPGVPIL